MSNTADVIKEATTAYPSGAPGFTPWMLMGSVFLIAIDSGVAFVIVFVYLLYMCLVYPMLPVSLDCPFFIASSVFYLTLIENTSQRHYTQYNINVHFIIKQCS